MLVDHQHSSNAAMRVAAATELSPLGLWAVHQVGKVSQGVVRRQGKPVAPGLGHSKLVLDVIRQVRKRIALAHASSRSYILIAAGERNRLERQKINFVGIVQRKPDDGPHLIVVHAVDDRRDGYDVDARFVHVFNGAQLDVKQIAHFTVAVGVVADPVELQVGQTKPGVKRALRELFALCEFNTIRRRLDAVVSQLSSVTDGINEVGRHGRLAPRKLYG